MRHQSKALFAVVVMLLLAGILTQDLRGQSNRTTNKLGFHLGLLGDPFPTLLGFNANYNITDFVRATVGYGSVSADITTGTSSGELTATTIGAGAKFFIPDWNFTPVVGIGWATVSVKASAIGLIGDVGGFSGSGSHLYAAFGVDWQTGMGFNFGAGYNYSLKSGVGGLPYINLGWFFAI